MTEFAASQTPVTTSPDLTARVATTLDILHRRGYAVPIETFCRVLHQGPAEPRLVAQVAQSMPEVKFEDGFVFSAASHAIVAESKRRQSRHVADAPPYERIAGDFTRELLRTCPWIESVLLAGSLSSRGFVAEDDVDFNLVVADGTKFLTYVLALSIGAKYAWDHRHRAVNDEATTPFLPKLVCINVIWERRQTRPFSRQDPQMAFELLMSRPLFGHAAFKETLAQNPSLVAHFPQMRDGSDTRAGLHADPSALGRLLAWSVRHPPIRDALDNAALLLARALHRFVRWTRRHNPSALRHVEHVDTLKHPYAILDPATEAAA